MENTIDDMYKNSSLVRNVNDFFFHSCKCSSYLRLIGYVPTVTILIYILRVYTSSAPSRIRTREMRSEQGSFS